MTIALSCARLRFMNTLGMRQRLSDMVQDAGSAVKFADKHGLSHSHVSAIIRGDKQPGNRLLKVMGLKRVVTERKTMEMKFEDITN